MFRFENLDMWKKSIGIAEKLFDKEFIQFLNIAKRSSFENANMIILFEKKVIYQLK